MPAPIRAREAKGTADRSTIRVLLVADHPTGVLGRRDRRTAPRKPARRGSGDRLITPHCAVAMGSSAGRTWFGRPRRRVAIAAPQGAARA